MDSETLKLVGFQQVLELLQGLAQTSAGRRVIKNLRPRSDSRESSDTLRMVEELIGLAEELHSFDLSVAEGLSEAVDRLSLGGSILNPDQLLRVAFGVQLAARLASCCQEREKSALSTLLAPACDLSSLSQEIERVINDDAEVRSSADPELAGIRKQIKIERHRVQKYLEGYLKGKSARHLISEPYITRRNERYVIPVRVEAQTSIPGVVHASSGSGATVFLEPLAAVNLNNRLLQSENQEIRKIQQLMVRLSEAARNHFEELLSLVDRLAQLDACQAAAEFARRHRCCLPVVSESGELYLENARHPLLEVAQSGAVPITIRLSREQQILVISGPNAGGKTVALKTIGLFCCMAQAGLPIPADRAVLPCFRQILADIGDHQSIGRSLSTFSAHLQRGVEILKSIESPSLVLLDEVGSGTNPAFGAALGVVLMDELSRDAVVVVTTHLDQVKAFAAARKGAVNASVELDNETMAPTFQIVFGQQGASSAFEIASQLGFPARLLKDARRHLSSAERQAEDHLARLSQQARELSLQEGQLAKDRKDVRQRLVELEQEKRGFGQQARKELEKKLAELEKDFQSESKRILKGIRDRFEAARVRKETERQRQRLKEVFRERLRTESQVKKVPHAKSETFQVGSKVWASELKRMARITEIDRDEASVEIGGKRMRLKLKQLEPVQKGQRILEPRPQVRLEIVEDTNRELNLVGKRVDEALHLTDKFLDRAFVSSLEEVRLIHGFGTGSLGKAVQVFLAGHPHVSDFRMEGGATLVRLNR